MPDATITLDELLTYLADRKAITINNEAEVLQALGYFDMTFETDLAYARDNY